MIRDCRFAVLAALFASTILAAPAWSQEAPSTPVKITLHPAPTPTPVLKYRLTTEFIDRIPGNAAVYYGKVTAEEAPFFNNRKLRDNVDRWQQSSLEELLTEKASVGFPKYFVDQAARCSFCDWQLPVHEPVFDFWLAEVQQLRQFARYLAAEARIAIAHGDFAAAIDCFRLSYATGHNVAEGETLVNALVGIAICSVTSEQALEMVQQPEAPNLYWAYTALPNPLVDFRDAVEAVSNSHEIATPELRHPDQSGRSPEQWRETLLRLWEGIHDGRSETWEYYNENLFAQSLRIFPQAKHRLVQRGWKAGEVAKLPVSQVLLIDALAEDRELAEAATAAFFLPYPDAMRRFDALTAHVSELDSEGRRGLLASSDRVKAIYGCRRAQVRMEREFAFLRLLEALRAHADGHDGALPDRLSDVTVVPVPNDPVTELPFHYELNGNIAHVSGPPGTKPTSFASESGELPFEYEITMAPAAK
jgi:hypothetical protein